MTRAEVLTRVAEMVAYARSLLRRRRVLARGRRSQRPRVPLRGARARDRGRRDHAQHPRHRRLHDARRVRRADRRHPRRTCPGVERRDPLGPLPRRPRPRGRQHAGRLARGRAPGRGHHQRHRRARRQQLARGGRDGAADARRRCSGSTPAIDTPQLTRLVEAGRELHRDRRAAQQGDRRRQRVRPRVRHPPGRHAQAPGDLRDHAARGRRRAGQSRSCSASTPGATRSPTSSPSSGSVSTGGARARVRAVQGPRGSQEDVADADLRRAGRERARRAVGALLLDGLQVGCGTIGMPTATVRLRGPDGQLARPGRGRHRAGRRRVQGDRRDRRDSRRAARVPRRLRSPRASTRSARSPCACAPGGGAGIARGHGADTDIVVASAKAYLAAVNRVLDERGSIEPRTPATTAPPLHQEHS